MKKILRITVITVTMLACSIANISAQKVAHIDLDSLITLLPESKLAQEKIQVYAQQLEDQVTAMQTELQAKYTEYQAKSRDMAELVRASKEKELNDLNQRIQDFQQQAQTDYQKKTAELSQPVYEKAKKAIEVVAKENAFRYVLDTSTGLVLFNDPADDIMGLVLKKLGVTPSATTIATPPVKK